MKHQSAQSILASVAKPPELAAAETEIVEIRARVAEFNEAISSAQYRLDPGTVVGCATGEARITLQKKIEEANAGLAESANRLAILKQVVADHSTAYSGAISAAIAPCRADAASRIAKALQLYEAAWADLKQTDSVLLSVNVQPTKIPVLPFVKAVISTATQIARECEGES
jgi:hypothetical protein